MVIGLHTTYSCSARQASPGMLPNWRFFVRFRIENPDAAPYVRASLAMVPRRERLRDVRAPACSARGARVPPSSELPVPNLFLASLPQDDFEALQPHFERVRLSSGKILHKMGSPIEYCYFTDGGMTSLIIDLEDGASVEVGVIGKEGFSGSTALMGLADVAPVTSMIQ